MEATTVNTPEQLGDIPNPKRARYVRSITLELSHIPITSHLLADIGAPLSSLYLENMNCMSG